MMQIRTRQIVENYKLMRSDEETVVEQEEENIKAMV